MKIFAFRVKIFDEDKPNYEEYVRGWVCAESYSAAAAKIDEAWRECLISFSLYEMEYEDFLMLEDTTADSFPFMGGE